MFFLVLWAIGLISGIVQILITKQPFNAYVVSSTLLLHQFVVTSGLVAVIGVYSNIIAADKTAEQLNWPGGPFQIKYGFTQLGLLAFGIMAIFYKGEFWIGALLINYLYGVMGGFTLIHEMVKAKKINKDSMARVIMDAAYQVFLTILSIKAEIW